MPPVRIWENQLDPPPCDEIKVGEEHEACTWRPLVIARALFTLAAVAAVWIVSIPHVPLPSLQAAALVIGGTLIYVSLGYLIGIEPSGEKLGWRLGSSDDATSWSEEWNRGLSCLSCLLGPGRFVAESLLDARLLFACNAEPVTVDDLAAPRDAIN